MVNIGSTDVFISYSKFDATLARELKRAIESVGAKTFLAEVSIPPGSDGQEEIFRELGSSKFVFFLASKASCESSAVQQELGASLIQKKVVIPILIDISAADLPGFIGTKQAIDIRKDTAQLHQTIHAIGKKLRDERFLAGLILAAVAIAIIASK